MDVRVVTLMQVEAIVKIWHLDTKSFLQGASLSGVRMQRANLEGASLMACNFEDPTGVKSANLEGNQVEKQIDRQFCCLPL